MRRGYGLVLCLIVTTYGLALIADRPWRVALLLLVQAGTAWQTLRVARAGYRLLSGCVFLCALAAAVAGLVAGETRLGALTFVAASVLYLSAPVAVVRDLGLHRGVDRETLLGALSAYLLIGMAFGFAYACVGALQPGPFFGAGGDPALPEALFFSFVTMTTTGYGDLVPAGNPGQTIAVLEALIGQLFLVTAVAKIVENWRPRRRPQ